MSEQQIFMHYVCTMAEAKALVKGREKFWVSNCGCRESGPGCKQSRTDVCLMFSFAGGSSGSNPHEISKAEMEEIFREAETKNLVTRPFLDNDFKETDGICFCCCGYFMGEDEACNKGKFIEETDVAQCINCGICVEVCYFHARSMDNGVLKVERDKCYGCGLCEKVCPVACIQMVQR